LESVFCIDESSPITECFGQFPCAIAIESVLFGAIDISLNALRGDINNPVSRLRTAPQLFTSGNTLTHDNSDLNEDGSWIEGVYNVKPGTTDKNGNLVYNASWANKTWPQITGGTQFPYEIRLSADSFPCTVFYQEAGKEKQLLG
jgi:hypothetical protein